MKGLRFLVITLRSHFVRLNKLSLMRLLLPLKYYDDAGRVKPSKSLLWCLFYICRPIWVFIASLTFRQDSGALLALFYPHNSYFYSSLVIALPSFLVVLMISFRTKIWDGYAKILFKAIKPLILLSLVTDIGFHLVMASKQNWGFSWLIALTILLDGIYLYWIKKNKHIAFLSQDWSRPPLLTKPSK